jgi:hypothetical protein
MLEQLALLAGAGEPVLCIGPLPAYLPPPLRAEAVRPPFGLKALGGWRMERPSPAPQVVHAWSLGAHAAAAQIAYDLQRPQVLSLPCLGEAGPAQRALTILKKGASPRLVLTLPSPPARQAMLQLGAEAETVCLLPPPAGPIPDAAGRRRRVRPLLGVGDDEILLVEPEDMVRGAGHKYAIWAHGILRQVLPSPRLLLPGHGPYEASIRFFAGTTGYDPEIYFTGDDFSRADCLAAADVAVFLGERDTSPSALAAAMAAGLPIAASRTPDALLRLKDRHSAVLVGLGDPRRSTAALLDICDQPDLRERMGQAARQSVSDSPAQVRCELEAIYREIARERCDA